MLEVLHEPLESDRIMISRTSLQVEYPAEFQLLAAMKPCPCGFFGDLQQANARGKINAQLSPNELIHAPWVNQETLSWLGKAIDKLDLSTRAFHRILRIGRAIADLESYAKKPQSPILVGQHFLKEALAFRQFDKNLPN